MKKTFFRPHIGTRYQDGIFGKKTLVMGASFYCDRNSCKFFRDCTDVKRKDSSEFDYKCPEYVGTDVALHDEPSNCVAEQPYTYRLFGDHVAMVLGMPQDEFWDSIAFTNYVQFFLPAEKGARETRHSDLSSRDFEAFIEIVTELRPDIVIVWGCVVNSPIKEKNPYLVSRFELEQTEWYICHINVPGVNHSIAVINPFHPISNGWLANRDKFDKYLLQILNTNDDENKRSLRAQSLPRGV